MKIIFVINEFNPAQGGAIGVMADEVRFLRRMGHDVEIFTGNEKVTVSSDSVWEDIPIRTVPTKNPRWMWKSYIGLRNFRIERQFRDFIRGKKADVVHFHNMYFHLPFSLLKIARQQSARVFFTAHDVMTISPNKLFHFIGDRAEPIQPLEYRFSLYEEWRQTRKAFNPLRRYGIRYYLRFAHKIFAVSNELKIAMNMNGIRNVDVLHNAVDPARYNPDLARAGALKDQYGLGGKKIVLTAGRMSVQKGGQAAVNIMDQLRKKIPDAVLVVLTNDVFAKQMTDTAKAIGISDKVIPIKSVARSEMPDYYAMSDVVIMPSLCLETFGLVALEAMACAKPVVVSLFGGGKEMVQSGINGYVANPLRTDEFAQAIYSIIKDPKIAHRMGNAALQIVKRQFTLEQHMANLMRYYTIPVC